MNAERLYVWQNPCFVCVILRHLSLFYHSNQNGGFFAISRGNCTSNHQIEHILCAISKSSTLVFCFCFFFGFVFCFVFCFVLGFFLFLFYLGVHSGVLTCSPIKPRAGMYQTVWLLIAHMFWASHKQWEVAILILIRITLFLVGQAVLELLIKITFCMFDQ